MRWGRKLHLPELLSGVTERNEQNQGLVGLCVWVRHREREREVERSRERERERSRDHKGYT